VKKIIFALLTIIFIFVSNSYGMERENINGIRYDYLLHYESACIGAITMYGFNKGMFDIKEDYGLFTVGVPVLLVGILKEFRDYRANDGHIPKDSLQDFSCTILGAITGKLLTYTF